MIAGELVLKLRIDVFFAEDPFGAVDISADWWRVRLDRAPPFERSIPSPRGDANRIARRESYVPTRLREEFAATRILLTAMATAANRGFSSPAIASGIAMAL